MFWLKFSGSADQRILVTIGKLGTVQTITPYFMGQILFIPILKTKLTKKSGLIGKDKHLLDFQALGLVQAGFDQQSADATFLFSLGHGQRTNFRQIIPADMQRTDTEDSAVLLIHNKIPQMVIERTDRTGQHQALGGKDRQQAMDETNITHPGR